MVIVAVDGCGGLLLFLLLASNDARTIRYDEGSTQHWPTSWPGAFSVQVRVCTPDVVFTVKSLTPSHSGLAFVGNQLPMATSYLRRIEHGCIHFAHFNRETFPKLFVGASFLHVGFICGFDSAPQQVIVYLKHRSFDKLRLVYMTFKADLKARAQCHLLDNYYRCKRLCDRCAAVQPMNSQPHDMTYKNTAVDAPYAGTCKDHSAYLNTAKQPSPWCKVQGFRFETISFDTMHLIYLGIAKNHVPSAFKILRLLGFHYEVGETDEQFLKRLGLEMKQDCKEMKILANQLQYIYFLAYIISLLFVGSCL